MIKFQSLAIIAALSAGLSACVTPTPPVNVTRFHNAQAEQIIPGSVTIVSAGDEGHSRSLEQATYSAAVIRELQRVGFTDAGSAAETSKYIARISVEQSRITAGGKRSPISVGVGGRTGGYGSGVGVGIGINLGGAPKDRIATELSVRIANRSDDKVVWEGRSTVEAKDGSPASQPALAASKLAEALFTDFPGESGATIKVP